MFLECRLQGEFSNGGNTAEVRLCVRREYESRETGNWEAETQKGEEEEKRKGGTES